MTVAELIDADTSGMLGKHASWERVPLAEVATILNGAPFDSALFSTTEGVPLIRIRDVITGQTNTFYTGTYEDAYLVQQGELLVGMDGDFNSGFWGPKTALLNQRVCKISPTESFYDKRLLALTLPGYLAAINANTPSVTVKHLSSKTIGAIGLPLPPRAEQTRIVAKLEELLSDLNAGVAELKAAQKKLAQYRQSLLKAAVEGTLTADWRAARAPLPPRGGGAGGEGANTPATDDELWLQARARELRQQQTPDEQALWQQLRAKRFSGHKFRRQQVLGHFIVDFVCFAKRLIVELDGGQHAEAVEHDGRRDAWLEQQGFRVLRFWNNEWSQQPEAVLESIWQALQQEPPLPNPSPARGEGLPEPESGAQLLQRILTERRARWEARQLAKFKEQGKAPPKDWQKKYPEPVQPDTTGLPELPEGWVWATIDQIAQVGTGVTPLRSKSAYFNEGTVPWVTSGALNSETVTSATELVTELALKECRLELYPVGSLLVAMYGEGKTRGKCSELLIAATINQAIAAIVLEPSAQPSKAYLKAFLLDSYERMRAQASGGVQPNLNLQIVKSIVLPLPPHSEQTEITQLLDGQFDQISQQRLAVERGLKQSSGQRQNILRAAFSGQLVPQDPADEPASLLLARIRAERADREKQPKIRKSKRQREIAAVVNKLIDVLAEAGDWVPAQEAFRRCGVADGALTDQIEELYVELRALDKAGRLAVEAVTDAQGRKLHDRLKLLKACS
jgi:type I restriction enzyme S subunit